MNVNRIFNPNTPIHRTTVLKTERRLLTNTDERYRRFELYLQHHGSPSRLVITKKETDIQWLD